MPPALPRCSIERSGEFVTPFEVWQKGAGTLGTVTHLRGQMRPRAACRMDRRESRYASAAYCGTTTVMLFASLAEAEHAKSLIDSTGCGHACRAEHELVDLGKSPAA